MPIRKLSKSYLKSFSSLTFVFILTFQISSLNAVNYTFQPASGDWSVAGNWAPAGGPPNAADNASINNNRVAAVTSADTAAGVFIGGVGDGTVNVSSGGTLTSGTLNVSLGSATLGTVTVNGATAVINNTAGTGVIS